MPSSNGNWQQTRHDKYYQLAKEYGYRSRASFKLLQINKKYKLLESCKSLLDLCAAPGGWLQIAQQVMPTQSMIIGVDLLPIRPLKGCITLQHDITTHACETSIKQQLQGWSVDVVTHDGAPNVAGGHSFSKDSYQQNELVLHSLALACKFLRAGGSFITKVFRSADYNSLVWIFKQLFDNVHVEKPPSSRSASAEIFIVCLNYKNPKQIDKRMFSPDYVFQNFSALTGDANSKGNIDIFNKKNKTKRNRSGYDDNASMTLSKTLPVSTFVAAANETDAITMLGTYNTLQFLPTSANDQLYKQQSSPEILQLCTDLKVLGKGDFKQLLKWRKRMQLIETEETQDEQKDDADSDAEETTTIITSDTPAVAEDEESALTAEIGELRALEQKQLRKQLKKKQALRTKQRKRLLTNVHNENLGTEVAENDATLFTVHSLDSNKAGGKKLQQPEADEVTNVDIIEQHGEMGSDVDSSSDSDDAAADSDDSDTEDIDTYYDKLEQSLDVYYDQYKQLKRKRQRTTEEEENTVVKHGMKHIAGDDEQKQEQHSYNSSDDEIVQSGDDNGNASGDDDDDEHNPLVQSFKQRSSAADKVNRWFSRDIFAAATETDKQYNAENAKKRKAGSRFEDVSSDDDEDVDDDSDDDVGSASDEEQMLEEEELDADVVVNGAGNKSNTNTAANNNKRNELHGLAALGTGARHPDDLADGEFETVPQELELDSDDDAVAERLAIGKQMLTKRGRDTIVNSGYNRYTFNDEGVDELPQWFRDDEVVHMHPNLPVTAEQVSLQKARLIAINARPIKKIAEAKARKKVRAVRRWEKLKQQTDTVMNQTDLTAQAKTRQIETLMKKTHKRKKDLKDKQYVVSKKGGGGADSGVKHRKGARIVKVDRRMKKDKRGDKVRIRREKAGFSGKGSKRRKAS